MKKLSKSCRWWKGGHTWSEYSDPISDPVQTKEWMDFDWVESVFIYQKRKCIACGKVEYHWIVES